MLVTYTAPNRAHHYPYALALDRARVLRAFVSGFSRFSRFAAIPELGGRLVRRDEVQNFYIASLKARFPQGVSERLAHVSKVWLDKSSFRYAAESDVFLFYSGAGLRSARRLRDSGTLRVVEVVNSHLLLQEEILREEHARLRLPWRGMHSAEASRRLAEYEEADYILGPSTFVKESFVKRGIPSERFLYVPYGLPSVVVQQGGERQSEDVFRVLYVGQISIRKGLRYLIAAFNQFQHPRKELWIVGPQTQVSGLDDMTLPDNVRFFGVLKGQELRDVYRAASVFVLPSLEDGFGLVLGEALAAGLPVIATTNTGAADLYSDGKEGWIVPIRDPDAISSRLHELADSRSTYQSMSECAFSRSRALNGWEVSGRSLVAELERAVQQTRCVDK